VSTVQSDTLQSFQFERLFISGWKIKGGKMKASLGKRWPTHAVKIVTIKGKEIGVSCTNRGAFGGSKFDTEQKKLADKNKRR
jgi:hypothetical protein